MPATTAAAARASMRPPEFTGGKWVRYRRLRFDGLVLQ